jgi:hypothetical protein
MELREFRFWTLEAKRMRDLNEASMADAVRYGYHAGEKDYERYARGLRARPGEVQEATAKEQKSMWEKLKAKGRG